VRAAAVDITHDPDDGGDVLVAHSVVGRDGDHPLDQQPRRWGGHGRLASRSSVSDSGTGNVSSGQTTSPSTPRGAIAVGLRDSAAEMDPATFVGAQRGDGAARLRLRDGGCARGAMVESYRLAVGIVDTALGVLLGVRVLSAASATPSGLW
jgi:hypothetical protein